MKKHRIRKIVILLVSQILSMFLISCGSVNVIEKQEDLPFTVISEECLSKELLEIVEERKQKPFKLTFSDQGDFYIVQGYGEQNSGGYSILVNALFRTANGIYIDTSLLGPKVGTPKSEIKTYPYIVVRTKDLNLPVVFN